MVRFIARFELGEIVVTKGVLDRISELDQLIALNRHANCDWGDVCEEDALANENALHTGGRIFSVYRSSSGIVFWVITEADRSYTTLLLPEEY